MLRILGKIQRIGIITERLPKIEEPALEEIGAQLKAKVGETVMIDAGDLARG